ncbi:MAG: bifunctional protein-serine/threonine kinase/phosphatase [Gammaproteobacteria bacterium]|jgi:serine/threonine protein phosphatase PrpC|nr:bifunctional protein-serine/threonine kinase/phosphatase [Gammaproteobacteria bacterium]
MAQCLQVGCGGASSPGHKAVNQDAFAVRADNLINRGHKGMVAVVADGVSQCADGKQASQTCVTGFIQDYFSTPATWGVEQSVSQVLSGLNRWLYRHNHHQQRVEEQLLTTCTAAVIQQRWVHIFHVGDSRAYILRNGRLQRLTTDHNFSLGKQQILSRALGAQMQVQIDHARHALEVGDLVLLTTDGVDVDEEQLARMVLALDVSGQVDNLDTVCQALIAEAATSNASDNMTAVMLSVQSLPPASLRDQYTESEALPCVPPLKVGQSLDGYQVLDTLSATPRSSVYRVRESASGKVAVLKAPTAEAMADEAYRAAFIREEWLSVRVTHPRLVKGWGKSGPTSATYLVMDYVPGISLRQWMYDHPQPSLVQVRDIVEQIIGAVRALHRSGVQHRDLRPENILLDEQGQITLIDYGSVVIDGLEEHHEARVGALEYSAPDVVLGLPCAQQDQYALFIIAYEMLTGQLPFAHKSGGWHAYRRLSEFKYRSLLQWRDDLPPWLDGCFRRALNPEVRFRYQAISEFWYDFTHPNADLTTPSWRPLLESHPVRGWQLISTLLLLILVGQNFWLWW